MNVDIYDFIIIGMCIAQFGRDTANHGKTISTEKNGYVSFLALIIVLSLYWAAGLFN
jgi:hypothetical protein